MRQSSYIYPPRPEGAIPRGDYQIFEEMQWIAQLKFNDTRCLIKLLSDGTVELWNRHAERFRTYNPPLYLQEQLDGLRSRTSGYCLFDGGLLDQKHREIKNTIVIWDILVQNGKHLVGTTYKERYDIVRSFTDAAERWFYQSDAGSFAFGSKISDDIFVPDMIQPEQWGNAWKMIDNVNEPLLESGMGPLLEGLVFKNPDGVLEYGFSEKNNSEWMARSRIETGRHRF